MKTNFVRIFAALMLLAAFVLGPVFQPVQADGVTPTIDIVSVKSGESVTIRTHDFPASHLFTVRIGKYGTQGVNGTIVDTTNSGAGGSFDVTYKIPADLKSENRLAIRLEASDGYYSYNWFYNNTTSGGTTSPTPAPSTPSTGKPFLTILSVDKNVSVKVRAERLPANQTFTVRIGTYANFFKDYVVVGSINSGSGGTLEWTSNLPAVVKGVEWVSVRIDSAQKVYAYNAFKNVVGGTSGSTSGSTSGGTTGSTSGQCQIVSVAPNRSLATYEDFDMVWEVKNVSGKTWESNAVDYKYVSGASMHEKSVYDLQSSVSNGSTFKIIVDAKAPASKGSYTASWALIQGSTTLCNLSMTVTVK